MSELDELKNDLRTVTFLNKELEALLKTGRFDDCYYDGQLEAVDSNKKMFVARVKSIENHLSNLNGNDVRKYSKKLGETKKTRHDIKQKLGYIHFKQFFVDFEGFFNHELGVHGNFLVALYEIMNDCNDVIYKLTKNDTFKRFKNKVKPPQVKDEQFWLKPVFNGRSIKKPRTFYKGEGIRYPDGGFHSYEYTIDTWEYDKSSESGFHAFFNFCIEEKAEENPLFLLDSEKWLQDYKKLLEFLDVPGSWKLVGSLLSSFREIYVKYYVTEQKFSPINISSETRNALEAIQQPNANFLRFYNMNNSAKPNWTREFLLQGFANENLEGIDYHANLAFGYDSDDSSVPLPPPPVSYDDSSVPPPPPPEPYTHARWVDNPVYEGSDDEGSDDDGGVRMQSINDLNWRGRICYA